MYTGNIVMDRIAIQSDLSKYKGSKLSYSVRDPFQIIRNIGFGSYSVRKLNRPDIPELKFMAYDFILFYYPLNYTKMLI